MADDSELVEKVARAISPDTWDSVPEYTEWRWRKMHPEAEWHSRAEMRESARAAIAAVREHEAAQEAARIAAGPWGCHCDIESMDEGFQPDGCVIDDGRPQDCIYSHCGDKTKCEYWRPIATKGREG
jgi:hypothetical protein